MKVAVVQIASSTNKEDNLERTLDYIKEAYKREADIVAFPEFLMAYSPQDQTPRELYYIAEDMNGRFVSELVRASREYGLGIIATIYEKSNILYKVYDTALFIKGEIISTYRKLHLYDALGFKESDKLVAGDKLPNLVNVNEFTLGMMVCYDVRFPELARLLTLNGANVLVVPSAWVNGYKKVEHWQVMLRARAIENGCYIIAPDQVGNIYIGRSMIVSPYGDVLLDMNEREGLEVVEIDPEDLNNVRDKLPLLKHRRLDIYTIDIRY